MSRHRGPALILSLVVFCFLISPSLPADREAFDEAVNFSLSLSRLHAAINRAPDRIVGQTVLLDGVVKSITHYGTEESDFLVMVELVAADWDGVEEINLYQAYVLFGPDFMGQFPPHPSREPGPRVVPANSHILVAGDVVRAVAEEDGTIRAVVDAFRLRRLQ